jgi:hypothetical protein
MPIGGAWRAKSGPEAAAHSAQQPLSPDATPAPESFLYGPGWQVPAQPEPGPVPGRAGAGVGADLMSRLRGAYPQVGKLPTGKKLVLAVAAAAIVIVAVVVGLTLSGRSGPGTSDASSRTASSGPQASGAALASRQAGAVSSLLGTSAATRRSLEGAVSEIRNCSNLPGAAGQIRTVVSQRSTEYRHASALSLSGVANGTAVKSDLLAALRASLDADRDYLTWARQQPHSGCKPAAQSAAYSTAISADGQAGAAKNAFVQAWNPVATKYGLPQESPGGI